MKDGQDGGNPGVVGTPPVTALGVPKKVAPTPDRKPGNGKRSKEAPQGIAWNKVPATLITLLQETHPKEYYKLRLIRTTHQETVELANMLPVLDHVMTAAPSHCCSRMMAGEIESPVLKTIFRGIRDAINGVDDAIRTVAEAAKMELRMTRPLAKDSKTPAGEKK